MSHYFRLLLLPLCLFGRGTALFGQATVPFSCSNVSYQTIIDPATGQTTLYAYNVPAGSRTQVGNLINLSLNGLAYNFTDHYMYASNVSTVGSGGLVKVDANANVTSIPVTGLPGSFSADATPDGYMMLLASDGAATPTSRIYCVDINPARTATYGKLVRVQASKPYPAIANPTAVNGGVALSNQTVFPNDIAYNSFDGGFFGVIAPSTLVRINPQTGDVQTIAITGSSTIGNETGAFGSAFFDATNNLYVFANTLGQYYRVNFFFPFGASATNAGGTFPSSNRNDGAMCPEGLLINVSLSGTVFNDANGMSDNTVNGSGIQPGGLFAVAYDLTAGLVIDTVSVAANGTYTLSVTPNDNYNIIITTSPPAIGSTTQPAAKLPPNWVSTGERLGTGTGNDGTVNGVLPVAVGTTNITNANFGIRLLKLQPDFNSGYTNQQLSGNLNTNDNMPTGSTYGAVSGPPSGISNPSTSLPTINANGTYTFQTATPGVYTFDVPVCPPGQSTNCPLNRLTITIADRTLTTNPPAANPDLATTNAGTPVTLNTLANDRPGSNSAPLNPGSVTITAQPKNGTATVNPATGNITYTPAAGFTGKDTLSYRVCDSATPTARCATSYQVITVDPPEVNNTSASDDYNTGRIGTTITGNVLSNDKDAQGNAQTVTPVNRTIAGVGTVAINASGGYTFTPAAGTTYTGPVNVPYTVCDDGTPQACASATLYLLITPSPVPLPAELLAFRVERIKDCKAKLYWKTGTEISFAYFELGQSSDARDFSVVEKISAKGSGSEYGYEAELGNGTTYFRLKIVDNDLSYKLSNIISAQGDCAEAQIKVYPTLVKDKISIEGLSGAESIQIFDMNGKRVYTATAAAGTHHIAVQQYAAGVYAIVITTPQSEMIIEKFVKQ